MPTAQLTPPVAPATGAPGAASGASPVPSTPRGASALGLGLLVLLAYAAAWHGAAVFPDETRLQMAVAAVTALGAGAWLFGGGALRARAPRLAWTGLGLLAGFALWSGVTLAWSVAPDRTWIETNRVITYLLVLALAITYGASDPRALRRTATAYVWLVVVLSLYALAGKVLPGVKIGPLDFDTAGGLARLQAPLDYWNALAIVVVMAVPIVLGAAVDVERRVRTRLAAVAALFLFLLVLGLTYSRGGVLVAVVALGALLALRGGVSGGRLRALLIAVLGVAAVAGPLALAYTRHALKDPTEVTLHAREDAGLVLLGVAAGALAVLLLVAWVALRVERRARPSARRSKLIGWGLVALVVAGIGAGLIVAAGERGGIGGFADRQWAKFTSPKGVSLTDPGRLLSTSSSNRWIWWSEAAGAASDKPLEGWGAGSFPVTHLLYRRDRLTVQQPHSLPLQFLAEEGIVGAVLGLGALLALLVAAVVGVRRMRDDPRARGVAAALTAAAVAWAVHVCFDWEWDIPGATLPALVFLGVLAGAPGRAGRDVLPGPEPAGERVPGTAVSGSVGRSVALAGIAALCAVFAVSALLPDLSASKASDATVLAGEREAGPGTLEDAASQAALATDLDPLSDDGPLASAAIAERRGLLDRARGFLLDAIDREPNDVEAWDALARIEFLQGNALGVAQASQRALQLDPRGAAPLVAASRALALQAPAAGSATAVGTPLEP